MSTVEELQKQVAKLQQENSILHNTCDRLNEALDETVNKLNKQIEENKILHKTCDELNKLLDAEVLKNQNK
ncbi:hypothetical protein TRFO_01300 [Tritrichomonas foetus]|uniref:Uncharacterized protein n=1 Tax=Tritrichomonas foetus TaxID=1144522 RepID=A0A1J4K870_9EUKA|nr:hypothetical protein TRFO_01300 [Tritrichomonas foetus]|eukprot:OHT07170.1 hypothetical protein TRFO_01300 [Tritrichomonas foetus]